MGYKRGQQLYYHIVAGEPEDSALADLQTDFHRVLNCDLHPVNNPLQADLRFVNLQHTQLSGFSIRAGEWERYEICIKQGKLIVVGSDARGLIYAIYHLSEHLLGVDPLWFWADFPHKPKQVVDPSSVICISQPARFKYRGWFINGEDLLIGWPLGKSPLRIPMPHWGVKGMISYEVYEKIFETMLRLHLNFIIPATFTDICMPEYAKLFDRIVSRGLLFSHHHVEPVGVCPGFAFMHYCERHGIKPEFSWTGNWDVVEKCWQEYIDRLAEYGDHVIWQLGYRGKDDIPFWESETEAPRSMNERAAIIAAAIDRQHELISKRVGSNKVVCTVTLWKEGKVMESTDKLRYPTGTIRVWSDDGRTQTFPPELERDARKVPSGVYYHTSYWHTGPHIVQGNPPANVLSNYRRAVEAGATEYFLQHVSNIRPFIFNIRQISELMADQKKSAEEYSLSFCEHYYEDAGVAPFYKDFYNAFVWRREPNLRAINSRWLDGALELLLTTLIRLLSSENIDQQTYEETFREINWRLHLLKAGKEDISEIADRTSMANFRFRNWPELAAYLEPLLRSSLNQWKGLLAQLEEYYPRLSRGHRLYDENLRWQTILMEALTEINLELIAACSTKFANNDRDMKMHLENGARILSKTIERRSDLAEQEHFQGWFKGENLLSLSRLLYDINKLITST